MVVVDAPVADEHLGLEERVELPEVEQFVAEAAVEGLDPGVLPGRARIDEHACGAVGCAPLGDDDRDELGAVVETDERRCPAPLDHDPVKHGDDVIGGDRVLDSDLEALAGELVDDVEHLHLSAVDGVVELEVQRPQGVRSDEAHRADVGADTGEPLLLGLGRHLQPFVAPEAPDTLVVHRPAGPAQLLGRSSPTPAGPAFGEGP